MSEVLTGEVSGSKIAAVFPTRAAARDAAAALDAQLGLLPAQVKLIGPGSADVDIKLEPEGGGIWRTIVVAHVRLGLLGVVAGLGVFGLLMGAGVPFVTQSPWAAAAVLAFFGGMAGLLAGGLVSLRPDHDRYIQATRDAMEQGHTTVVVHALSGEQRSRAAELLAARGADVTGTL